MIEKRVVVFGHFGSGQNLSNGQTIKTKIVTEEIEKHVGKDFVERIDTVGGVKALPKLFFKCASALKKSKNVVIFPAENGLKFFVPVLNFFNKFKKRQLFYVVIGGWLPEYLKNKKGLAKKLKKFTCVFVETQTMKKTLQEMGFENVEVMPNCKRLKVLNEEDLPSNYEKPYKLCTFSRVMKEKGIEDAVNAVKAINEEKGETVFSLDIYGQVDVNQKEWFEDLQKTFPVYVSYKGVVDFDKSVEVLKEYYALLFPSLFFTEGIPGTIIDGYASGVPVIASRWESFCDVVNDGESGIGYEFGSQEELKNALEYIVTNSDTWKAMKINCLQKAKTYLPNVALKGLIDLLN